MPAVMEDPTAAPLYRVSGPPPFPDPSEPGLPSDITPRQVTLRDRQTVATIVPVPSKNALPATLLAYLCDQLNREIEGGDTYAMTETFTVSSFADYWFASFGAVMLLGDETSIPSDKDWTRECLGSFFIKPNYPGRSSHVCTGSFITTDASRNRGVGRLMGEAYVDWSPRLGYSYSVFNLVYETSVASCRIWDSLGFKRIGRVRGCGNLRSRPDQLVDALIYGRDLAVVSNASPDEADLVSEERFDKIRYYLKYAKYPAGADRAEKSRLRSAATHYKLLDGDKLMLKDKEVISDPGRQYAIARDVHAIAHAGINKTTATIAEKYHWSRIKETVSDVIRACADCSSKEVKMPATSARKSTTPSPSSSSSGDAGRVINHAVSYANPSDISVHHGLHHAPHHIMLHAQSDYQPIDPQIINHNHHTPAAHDDPFDHYPPHADFQALLNATEDVGPHDTDAAAAAAAAAAVDRDLEMLIEHDDDDDVRTGSTADGMDGLHEESVDGRHRGLYDVEFEP